MVPIEERGVSRLDGDATAGYNFSKAGEIKPVHFGLDMEYRTEVRVFSLDADFTSSDSADSEENQRKTLDLQYRRLWPDRWLTGAYVSFNQNDELGIDLRTSVGAGGGRILRQTNSSSLSLEGGLLLTREEFINGVPNDNSLEAFGTLSWDWFRYDSPELDISTELQLIPNLSDSGKYRAEFDISLKWELIEDLFWEMTFYDSYSSDPAVLGAEENDYGINTSLGWEF